MTKKEVMKKERVVTSNGEKKKDNKILVPEDSMWKKALLNLVDNGELTVEQYNSCVKKLQDKNNKKDVWKGRLNKNG